MNRVLRKRSSHLIILLTLITTLAFAYRVFLPTPLFQSEYQSPPDSVYTPKPPGQDSVYHSLLTRISVLFQQKKYESCLIALKEAQKIKPNVRSINEQVVRVERLIAQAKKTKVEYDELFVKANDYFAKQDYLNAKSCYQLALNVKPGDPAATEKLGETMKLLRSHKAQNILFDVAVAAADKLFDAGEYEKARVEYVNASKIMPEAAYPKEKINAVIKILVDRQVREELYRTAITAGDKFYGAKSYNRALQEFQAALKQKPDEHYPQEKIAELTKILEELAALEEAYKQAIALADQLLAEVRYMDARSGYEEALKLKSKEVYPVSKIREIDQILAQITKVDADYNRYLNLADSLYIERNFIRARQNYKLALTVKPNESYPKAMLAKTEAGVGTQQANELAMAEAYQSAVTEADRLFAEKAYSEAKQEYTNALEIKPGELYPQQKITEIDDLMAATLAQQKEIDEQYDRILANADKMVSDNLYAQAKQQYEAALELKPQEAYPKQKIEELNGILANLEQQREIDARYAALMKEASRLYSIRNYDPAKDEYLKALEIKPDESLPQERITAIDSILFMMANQVEELNANYAGAISKGDSLFTLSSWLPAKTSYQAALQLKPTELYPQEQINGIDSILADLAQHQALDDQYQHAVEAGDRLFADQSWDPAIASFQQALELKPEESYPASKITEIDSIKQEIARVLALNTEYQATIAAAEGMFTAKAYDSARVEYTRAGELKPEESLPGERIAQIDGILAALANQQLLDERYARLITEADQLLADTNYQESLDKFTEANALKPEEKYPQEKITDINAILAEIARQLELDEQYTTAVSQGDSLFALNLFTQAIGQFQNATEIRPAESYPPQKLAEIETALQGIAAQQTLDDQYQQAIEAGDRLFADQSWDPAIASFQQALELKPEESYPASKITEIDSIKQEIARVLALNTEYQATISAAEGMFTAKAYDSARVEYTRAGELKPEESLPGERIAQIDGILEALANQQLLDERYAGLITEADQLLADTNYQESLAKFTEANALKPEEKYPQEKITDINAILAEIARQLELDEQYATAVSQGDSLFALNLFTQARGQFQNATEIRPAESYPPQKLAEIETALQGIAAQQALDDQYQQAIEAGDRLFADQSWDPAIASFQQALELKPEESYPTGKITEIDSIKQEIARVLALNTEYEATIAAAEGMFTAKAYDSARAEYTRAGELKPEESLPGERIAQIDSILLVIENQRLLNEQYAGLVSEADQHFTDKQYPEAMDKFNEAITLKPEEAYPKGKIAEINTILADIARQLELDEQYATAVSQGDSLFALTHFLEAKEQFQSALEIKPEEAYPKQKLTEIEAALADYDRILTKGDQLFAAQSYDSSRISYVQAGALQPTKTYWQERVTEIDRILAEIRKQNEEYLAVITKADGLLAEEQYEPARDEYQNALLVKASESYPKEKIKEINLKLAELEGKRNTFDRLVANGDSFLAYNEYIKSRDTYQQALDLFPDEVYPKGQIRLITGKIDSIYRANRADYDKAVGEGDGFFNTFEYDRAIDAYTRAIEFLPMENYPREMIAKIRKSISENAIADVLSDPIVIKSNEEGKFSFAPVNIATRRNNFIYLKIRNLSDKQFNILVRYGQDGQTNGGLALRNISADGEINERLISVKNQDPWYREDNNWISLYPQGGDIEVSFIQVSRAIN